MTKTSAASRLFQLILCMWSDHGTIRPHAKYQRREPPRSRSEKNKGRLIIDGIFVVVVVVVLEAVGWIRGGYVHPVLDRFLLKM
jgi:hypothetical protein